MEVCPINTIDVSVIVLTYYHEQYIARALDSILSQETTYSYEIIVSDDCSGDSTVDIVNQYIEKYPHIIRLIRHENNIGTCQNIYDAMLTCAGRYIETTDGDDMWIIKDKLQRQVDFLDTHPDYFVHSVLIEGRYPDGSLTGKIYPMNKSLWGKEFSIDTLVGGESFSTAGSMMRNFFKQDKVKNEFGMLPKFSKYIEDLPMNFMYYDFGKAYLSNYVGYAITHRRKNDENQHNYNTIFNVYRQAIDHIKLIKNMQEYFGDRYDFSAWLVPHVADLIIISIKERNPSFLLKIPELKFKYWFRIFCLLVRKAFNKLDKLIR